MTQKTIGGEPQDESCAPGQAAFHLDQNRKSGNEGLPWCGVRGCNY